MNDCLFCKIIAGEIPSTKVYEDDLAYAFLDIHPKSFGHTLVVPKTHCENVFDIPQDVGGHLAAAVQTVARAIKQGMAADGVNITMNNGKAAGQDVFHAHVHIVPRHEGDWEEQHRHLSYKAGETEVVAQKIKSVLSSFVFLGPNA